MNQSGRDATLCSSTTFNQLVNQRIQCQCWYGFRRNVVYTHSCLSGATKFTTVSLIVYCRKYDVNSHGHHHDHHAARNRVVNIRNAALLSPCPSFNVVIFQNACSNFHNIEAGVWGVGRLIIFLFNGATHFTIHFIVHWSANIEAGGHGGSQVVRYFCLSTVGHRPFAREKA